MPANVETMAYAYEEGSTRQAYSVPWHGGGTQVHKDLDAHQFLEKANLAGWKLTMVPEYTIIKSKKHKTGLRSLVRRRCPINIHGKEVSPLISSGFGNKYVPTQPEELAEVVNQYVLNGDLEMNTAGSLDGGRMIYMSARMKGTRSIVKGDTVDSYMLFSSPNILAASGSIKLVFTRVVCTNTHAAAMSENSTIDVRWDHRRAFNQERVMEDLARADMRFQTHISACKEIASKRYTVEDMKEYIHKLFPIERKTENEEMMKKIEFSSRGQKVLDGMDTQPGVEFAQGSWWQVYNGVTYALDHVITENPEFRLYKSLYLDAPLKLRALNLAREYAGKSKSLVIA